MLKIENLSVCYGNLKAIDKINLDVNLGEIVVLIGANGAGKTTTLKAISGLVKSEPESYAKLDLSMLSDKRTLNRFAGKKMTDLLLKVYDTSEMAFQKIRSEEDITEEVFGKITKWNYLKIKKIRKNYYKFVNVDLLKVKAHKISSYGLVHVPEGRQVFAGLTVQENLEMGAFKRHSRKKILANLDEIYDIFPRLKERKKQKAGTLSGGEQQMLAIARAMMAKPKIILLDEPSMGLAPIIVKEVFEIIKKLNESGITIVLVEQNAKLALSIADRGYVLETGKIILSGTGEELLNNENVKKAYLGS
mgnify:FL=1